MADGSRSSGDLDPCIFASRVQTQLKKEALNIRVELESLSGLMKQANELLFQFPFIALELAQLQEKCDKIRTREITVEIAMQNTLSFHSNNPLGSMKEKYEALLQHLRQNPKLLAEVILHAFSPRPAAPVSQPAAASEASSASLDGPSVVHSRSASEISDGGDHTPRLGEQIPQTPSLPASLSTPASAPKPRVSALKLRQECISLMRAIVYSLYGNIANPEEEKRLLVFIRECIYLAYDTCKQPKDILENPLIKKLLPLYFRRIGKDYLNSCFSEPLIDVLTKEDFDLQIQPKKIVEEMMTERRRIQQLQQASSSTSAFKSFFSSSSSNSSNNSSSSSSGSHSPSLAPMQSPVSPTPTPAPSTPSSTPSSSSSNAATMKSPSSFLDRFKKSDKKKKEEQEKEQKAKEQKENEQKEREAAEAASSPSSSSSSPLVPPPSPGGSIVATPAIPAATRAPSAIFGDGLRFDAPSIPPPLSSSPSDSVSSSASASRPSHSRSASVSGDVSYSANSSAESPLISRVQESHRRSGSFGDDSSSSSSSSSSSASSESSSSSSSSVSSDPNDLNSLSPQDAAEVKRIVMKNTANLYSICIRIVSAVTGNATAIPYGIRYILKHLQKGALQKFPSETPERIRSVLLMQFFSSVICPAIVDPERVNVVTDHPVFLHHRERLAVVGNVLRQTASGVEFAERSPFAPLSVFVGQHKAVLESFMDQAINVAELEDHFISNHMDEIMIIESIRLTPIALSMSELSLLQRFLNQAEQAGVIQLPSETRSILLEVNQSGLVPDCFDNSNSYSAEREKYFVLHEMGLKRHGFIPEEPPQKFNVNPILKEAQAKAMQVLFSLDYIQQPQSSSLQQLLEANSSTLKVSGDLVSAAVLRETAESLTRLPASNIQLLQSMRAQLDSRKGYLQQLWQCKEDLVYQMDVIRSQFRSLEKEKQNCMKFLEVERIRPFALEARHAVDDFIEKFRKLQTVKEQRDSIRVFNDSLRSEIKRFMLPLSVSNLEIENASNYLYKHVMTRASIYAFAVTGRPMEQKDQQLHEKCLKLCWVTPAHFDVPERYHCESAWEIARDELARLDWYRTPEDKLNCIVTCCKILFELMKLCIGEALPSMDDFIPIFIWTIIKSVANPSPTSPSAPRFFSNLEFILNYVFPEDSQDEQTDEDMQKDMYLRHFETAITAIMEKYSVQELAEHPATGSVRRIPASAAAPSSPLASSSPLINLSSEDLSAPAVQSPSQSQPAQPQIDVAALEKRIRDEMLTRIASNLRSKISPHFSKMASVDELKYSEVPQLLESYKQLANDVQIDNLKK